MKIIEAFLEIIKQCFVFQGNSCTEISDKLFIVHAKLVIFSSILIPSLLQFPLIASGQDRADGVNSGHMPIIGFSKWKDVNAIRIVADICNFRSESGFKGYDCIAVHSHFTPSSAKNVINNSPSSSSNEAESKPEQNFFGITHDDIVVGLSLLFGLHVGRYMLIYWYF